MGEKSFWEVEGCELTSHPSPTSFQYFLILTLFWSKQVNISCHLWFLKDKILENKKSLLFYVSINKVS